MILRKLTINNIRSYAGQAVIDFATDPKQNVTLVHGVNGAGKTSLFLALNWALYGADVVKYSGHLLNETLLRQAKPGDSVTGSVSLEFEEGNDRFFLSRGITGWANESGVYEKQAGVELYRIDAAGQSKSERLPDHFVEKMLPSAIRTFFFFDGDKIAEFTKPGKEQDRAITKAVNDVLRLDLINRAATHVGQISSKLNKEIAAKGSDRMKELQAVLERKAAAREELSDKRVLLGSELAKARERRAEIDAELTDIREVAEVAKRRIEVEKSLTEASIRKANARRELMKLNIEAFTVPLSTALGKAEDFLEEKRHKRQIPGNFKDQLLMDLLEHQVCICDRELLPATPAFLHIEELLSKTVPSSIQERALTLSSEVKRLLKTQDMKRAAILSKMEQLHQAEQQLDDLKKYKESLDVTIANEINTKVQDLQTRRAKIDSDRDHLLVDLGRTEAALEKTRKEYDDLQNEFLAETQKQADLDTLRIEAELASRAARMFAEIKERLVEELKGDMSEEATRIFKSFTWKTDFFKEVRVGDEYLLELYDEFGRDMRSVMSAGETQLLSLAFMLSMTAVSDIEAPLVIDTPLARLDKTVRRNLLAALPSLTRQLVLLVTDTEMDGGLRPVIENSVGKDYLLNFNDGISSIQTGAFV